MDNQYYNNQYQQPTQQPSQQENKSKIVAALLAFFLGTFGVHNFYLGYTKKAVIQLVLTIVGILTSCIFVGVFIVIGVGIWALVEAVFLLIGKIAYDGNGLPLTN